MLDLEVDRAELWRAVAKAGEQLGLQGILPRLIARNLVQGWEALVPVARVDGGVRAEVTHLCGARTGCDERVEACLSAVIVEALLHRHLDHKAPYVVVPTEGEGAAPPALDGNSMILRRSRAAPAGMREVTLGPPEPTEPGMVERHKSLR